MQISLCKWKIVYFSCRVFCGSKRSKLNAKRFPNFHIAPIPSPDISENSNSDADSESECTSCSELESETGEEIVLSLSGMQVFFLIGKEECRIEFSN